MKIQGIFAVACVSDMQRSVEWYAALLGRDPDDRPMDGLVQWRNGDGAGVQQGDFGIIAQISDPDDNRITLAEPPKAM